MLGLASAGASIAAQTTPVDAGSALAIPATTPTATLVAGTPVTVMTNEEISTVSCVLGRRFGVTVVREVVDQGTVVIPAGAIGSGEITFCTNKGAFGKPGILGMALRTLDLNGKSVLLDGRYREEGRNNNGATAVTFFAAGIVSGLIKGKAGVVPKGRELRARTGEDIIFVPGATPPAVPGAQASQPLADPAGAATQTTIAAAGDRQPGSGEDIPQPGSR
jgi:hypothetical protein